jgi:hypothetical protein
MVSSPNVKGLNKVLGFMVLIYCLGIKVMVLKFKFRGLGFILGLWFNV